MSDVHEGGCLCGTVTWTAEALPGMRGFAGGSFDETFEKGTLPPKK